MSGVPPFRDDSVMAVRAAPGNDQPGSVQSLNPAFLIGVEVLVRSVLANQPDFSPDGRPLASGGTDKMIRLHDVSAFCGRSND